MATKTSALNAALLEAGTAGEILAALGAVEYRRLHPGRDWSGSVDVEPWGDWLAQCPAAALGGMMKRMLWINGSFLYSLPDVARIDWRHEHHTPAAPWVAFGDSLIALSAALRPDLWQTTGRATLPSLTGAGIEALHGAWRLVRSCTNGTLDKAELARWCTVDTEGFIERFPVSGARMRAMAKDWPDGVPDGHPLGPVMAAWLADHRPRVDAETRPDKRILPRITGGDEHPALVVGSLFRGLHEGRRVEQPELPLWPGVPDRKRVPILDVVDAAGVPVVQRGGAPVELRLFVRTLSAVPPWARAQQASFQLPLRARDLLDALWPMSPTTGRRTWRVGEHWPKLRHALLNAREYAIHDGTGRWFPLGLR